MPSNSSCYINSISFETDDSSTSADYITMTASTDTENSFPLIKVKVSEGMPCIVDSERNNIEDK